MYLHYRNGGFRKQGWLAGPGEPTLEVIKRRWVRVGGGSIANAENTRNLGKCPHYAIRLATRKVSILSAKSAGSRGFPGL